MSVEARWAIYDCCSCTFNVVLLKKVELMFMNLNLVEDFWKSRCVQNGLILEQSYKEILFLI